MGLQSLCDGFAEQSVLKGGCHEAGQNLVIVVLVTKLMCGLKQMTETDGNKCVHMCVLL